MKAYFNIKEFKYIINSIQLDPWYAITKFKKYFAKYPKDYTGYAYFICTLVIIKDLDAAEKILHYVFQLIENDSQYQNNPNYLNHFQKDFFFVKAKLLSYQEKYQELYQLFLENPNLEFENSHYLLLICKKKLGILNKKDCQTSVYFYQQIIDYKEKAFIEHIRRHQYDYNLTQNKPNKAIFDRNFPFNKVLEIIKDNINSYNSKCLYSGYYVDTYLFKLNKCGKVNNKPVNYFKVVCFHNTCQFISMYPTNKNGVLPVIDLNNMLYSKEIDCHKINQREKINKRYQKSK